MGSINRYRQIALYSAMLSAYATASQADAAVAASNGGKFQVNDKTRLWGKVIPITYGKRRVTGQPLQAGELKQKTEVVFPPEYGWQFIAFPATVNQKRTATFAYTFGAPGNPDSRQILTRLWVDGVKVYDATTGERKPGLSFHFYEGDETQIPDATLNQNRFDYPIAYRGLMYIVFYDYDLTPPNVTTVTMADPSGPVDIKVEAEIWEQLTNPIVSIPFAGAPSALSNRPGFDKRRGHLYNIDGDDNIYAYDIATGVEVSSAPITGFDDLTSFTGFYNSGSGFFVKNGVPYFVGTASGTNSRRVYLINAETGAVVSGFGVNDSSLTPDATHIQGISSAVIARVGGVYECSIIDIFRQHVILRIDGEQIEFDRIGGDYSAAAPSEVFSYLHPSLGWLVVAGASVYKEDGTLLFTGTYPIFGLFGTSAFEDLIVFEYQASPAAYRIYRKAIGGSIKWEYNNGNSAFGFTGSGARSWREQSNTQGQYIAWMAGSVAYRLDMLAGVVETITGRSTGPGTLFIYDDYLRVAIQSGGVGPGAFPIYNGTTGNITLGSLLRNLAERQGYADADITVTGIDDTIIGAAITEIADLSQMLEDLSVAYNFEIVKRGKKILFTRRVLGGAFAPDGEIAEADRAILEEDGDAYITLRSGRRDGTQAPGKVQLFFIDPDLQYVVNQVEHQRNDSQANLSQALTLALPVIMTASDAATLAARVIVNATEGRMEHEFLLSQKFMRVEPGDYYDLVTDDFTDVVKFIEVTYNADHSISVKAEAVSTQIGPTVELPDYVLFDEDGPRYFDELKALIIDTPLLQATDENDTDGFESYATIIGAGRAPVGTGGISRGVSPTGPFTPVGAIATPLLYGRLLSDVAEVNAALPWVYLPEDTLRARIIQGDTDALTSVSLETMLAGANRLLVGNTSRFEFIGFTDVTYDPLTKVAEFTGLVRGLRGTDINVANHASGDFVIFYSEDTLIEDVLPVSELGEGYFYAAINSGGAYSIDDLGGLLVNGNARKPWAPANVRLEASGGDVAISWQRRTRLLGPLVDGSPDVPLDEASEAYELDIYRAGAIVRTVTGLGSPAFTYTAAMQAADGFSGTIATLQLDAYQISAIAGRGFVKAGTYNVE
jgi:hypothetical protein